MPYRAPGRLTSRQDLPPLSQPSSLTQRCSVGRISNRQCPCSRSQKQFCVNRRQSVSTALLKSEVRNRFKPLFGKHFLTRVTLVQDVLRPFRCFALVFAGPVFPCFESASKAFLLDRLNIPFQYSSLSPASPPSATPPVMSICAWTGGRRRLGAPGSGCAGLCCSCCSVAVEVLERGGLVERASVPNRVGKARCRGPPMVSPPPVRCLIVHGCS